MAKIKITNILRILETGIQELKPRHLDRLSDLNGEELSLLTNGLEKLPKETLDAFFMGLNEYSRDLLKVDFGAIGKWGLDNHSDIVRGNSVQLLRFAEDKIIHQKIMEMSEHDPSLDVRLKAVSVLGTYLCEKVPDDKDPLHNLAEIKACLERVYETAPKDISLLAMCGLAVFADDASDERIGKALLSRDTISILAALRSINVGLNENWNNEVLSLVNHPNDDIAVTALCACGVLKLRRALPALYQKFSHYDRYSDENVESLIDAFLYFEDPAAADVLALFAEVIEDENPYLAEKADDTLELLYLASDFDLKEDEPDEDEENDFVEAPSDFFTDDFDEDADEEGGESYDLMLNELIEREKDRCIERLEEMLPRDFDDFEEYDEYDEDECGCDDECCGHEHHHHNHNHHHEEEDGLDLSQMRIIDSLEDYENAAEADEEDDFDSELDVDEK